MKPIDGDLQAIMRIAKDVRAAVRLPKVSREPRRVAESDYRLII